MYPLTVLNALSLKRTCTRPYPLPQTYMNSEWRNSRKSHSSPCSIKEVYRISSMSERPAVLLPLPSQYLTSYCFSDYYLVMVSEGAVKTARIGSTGNQLGSPTFSHTEGDGLTSDIIQYDENQADNRKDIDGLLSWHLEETGLVVSMVQRGSSHEDQLIWKASQMWSSRCYNACHVQRVREMTVTLHEMYHEKKLLRYYFSYH